MTGKEAYPPDPANGYAVPRTRCGHKWTAVHPVGTTGLECPNCHEMEWCGMGEDLEREVTVQRAVINNLKGIQ